LVFFFQAEDGIRDWSVTGVQTCALRSHQHDKEFAQGYKDFFMASTHTDEEANQRSEDGWRSFIALELGSDANAISCPASKEAGFVTNCAKCSLCSGAKGKGKKNVKILLH